MRTAIVRYGGDFYYRPHPETGAVQHTKRTVCAEMLTQICLDYASLPDPFALTYREIRFFYEAIRPTLHRRTQSGS